MPPGTRRTRPSIAGLTLRDIATRVGMQQPSLYSHFASKQAIYDAMFRPGLAGLPRVRH